MAFSGPKSKIAAIIAEKKKIGAIPKFGKNPMNPHNVISQLPNLVPINPIPNNPMASTVGQFGQLRKKLRGL